MLSRKQIIIILSVVVLIGALYSLDIKGLVNPKEGKKPDSEQSASGVSTESISKSAKKQLSAGAVKQIEGLEGQLAKDPKNIEAQKALAKQWESMHVNHVSGLYMYQIAQQDPNLQNWLNAGDKLQTGIATVSDSTEVSFVAEKAIDSYQKALALDPESLDAKTGLGICYVETTQNPMQGITLLREVVEKDPENLKANMNLGLFSMKTGQYDKAEKRFLTVLKKSPSADAYFYLGEAYRNMGQKAKAIEAYQKTKEFMVDPQFTAQIDMIIKELK
ncbi:tetratricopeptide repeat protein [Solitalea canadensis]|uniref:Cytochrome c biogenesis factor n=1 Tax=Solitalea canadensis (strain ATCC 29591 / DSM 3403 / JCM 21819 / LMG 8368 / NBRC 15130 / NCIMB 12057 / USAM 9D) TaxID=929556 RepID=H8KSH4_SOLCM|nr:tetratricopeptide repeat protein [Solitalea canadensis]AFD08525.1 cytochrome c biogenesis factor [Solitalea canadensis DSM 3403]